MTAEEIREMVKQAVSDALKDVPVLQKPPTRRWLQPLFDGDVEVPKSSDVLVRGIDTRGLALARYVRALAAAKGDPSGAAALVKSWLDKTKSELDEYISKALSETSFEGGGALVPDQFVADLIPLLRDRAVVRAMGATVLPMNSGSMTLPRQTAGATAYYVGELQNVMPSQPAFGQIQLSAKKLRALVPVSNDLLRDAALNADMIVRDDMVTVMALREDLAFLRGDGTQNQPRGIRYSVNSGHVFARTKAGATVTLDEVTADLARCVRLLEEASIPMIRPGWIMTPRTKWFLMTLRDGNGNLVFAPEMRQGTLMGFPFRATSQIPNTLGAGTNESEIYFGDFAQFVIGENTQLLIDVWPGGAYFDGTQVVSGISTDQTVIAATARHDCALRHDKAFAIITAVDWGA